MKKKTPKTKKVEDVRAFLSALDVHLVLGGLMIHHIRFKRDEQGYCTVILMTYEEKE